MDERIVWFTMFNSNSDENPWTAQAATADNGFYETYHGEGPTKAEALEDLMDRLRAHGLA